MTRIQPWREEFEECADVALGLKVFLRNRKKIQLNWASSVSHHKFLCFGHTVQGAQAHLSTGFFSIAEQVSFWEFLFNTYISREGYNFFDSVYLSPSDFSLSPPFFSMHYNKEKVLATS